MKNDKKKSERITALIAGTVFTVLGVFFLKGIVQFILLVFGFMALFRGITGICLKDKIVGMFNNKK